MPSIPEKKTQISKSAHEHISWKERGHVKTQILHTLQTTAADIKVTQTEHVSWKERGGNNMLKQKSYILYRAQLLTQKLPNKTTLLLGVCHRYKLSGGNNELVDGYDRALICPHLKL